MLNPVPVTLAWETVTLNVPVFVSVTVCELLVLKVTFPKLICVGLAESKAVPPVPESGRVRGELVALLTRVRLPETLPETVGANATVKLKVDPGLMVSGRVSP
jgi:hypothetical protein